MLLEYLNAALESAVYEQVVLGSWHGRVPGLPGVYVFTTTRDECERQLKEVLDQFVLFRASRDLPLPPIGGREAPARAFSELLDLDAKVLNLEAELEGLKETYGLAVERRWVSPRVRSLAARARLDRLSRGLEFDRAYKFGLANWGVVLSALGLAAVLYAYVRYEVSYFENFQNTSTTKQSADFYRELGDRMLGRRDFKAAEDFYEAALKVNPNNIEATRGVLISQVFKVPEGKKYFDPGLAHLKLKTLEEKFQVPDHRLTFCKGYLAFYKNDFEVAENLFKESIRQTEEARATFAANYDLLGQINMDRRDDLPAGCQNLAEAVRIEPDNFSTQLNLGYCKFRLQRFGEAVAPMKVSFGLSPRLSTAVNLGNAYLFLWMPQEALEKYKYAKFVAALPGVEKEFFVSGSTTYHFMPEPEDAQAFKKSVTVSGVEQNKIFLDYMSALAHVMLEEYGPADASLDAALKADKAADKAADKKGVYRELFLNYVKHLLRKSGSQEGDERAREARARIAARLAGWKTQLESPARPEDVKAPQPLAPDGGEDAPKAPDTRGAG